jgi:hypothetical protein
VTALGDHAIAELDILGVVDPLRAATITIVGTLADLTVEQRDIVNGYVTILAQFKPLSPLTNDPAQWLDRSATSGERALWQSARDPDAWSRDDGQTFFRMSENGQIHTSDPA